MLQCRHVPRRVHVRAVSAAQRDRWTEPGPVLLVSTFDGRSANLMTNGFNMPVRHGGLIGIVIGPWVHSFQALGDTGECVLGIPTIEYAEAVVEVGNSSGAEIDKWDQFGFTALPASKVSAPLIGQCFANIECEVADRRLVSEHSLWLLRAVAAWTDERRRGSGEFHHRGNGTFSSNGPTVDLRDRMTKWPDLTDD